MKVHGILNEARKSRLGNNEIVSYTLSIDTVLDIFFVQNEFHVDVFMKGPITFLRLRTQSDL